MRSRRGNYATITALALTGLMGMGAISVDLMYARVVQVQLQAGADAITHASVMQLDGTAEGVQLAYSIAEEIAAANKADGQAIELGMSGTTAFATGFWSADTGDFVPSEDPELADAVRVQLSASDLGGWFARPAFARDGLNIRATSVSLQSAAVGGAETVECFIPLAIPQCLLDTEYGIDGVQDIELKLNPAGIDNTGWARPGAQPNASWLRDQIYDCESDGAVSVGDDVHLNNGVITSALTELQSAVEGSDTEWDSDVWGGMPDPLDNSSVNAATYGGTWEGPIFVFDDDTYCAGGGGNWTGTHEITGFVWGAVYDVAASGKAADRTISIRLDTTREHAIGKGNDAPDFGISSVDLPAIVK